MDASPMETLRTAVSALSFSDPAEDAIDRANKLRKAVTLIAQLPTIVARYERRRGEPAIDPDPSLDYAENFLTMLRGEAPTAEARAFDVAMILHAEHEMNASTFTARVVAGPFRRHALRDRRRHLGAEGPLHGGANQAAMSMFSEFGSADAVPEVCAAGWWRRSRSTASATRSTARWTPRAPILRALASSSPTATKATSSRSPRRPSARPAARASGRTSICTPGVLYHYLGIPTDLFSRSSR